MKKEPSGRLVSIRLPEDLITRVKIHAARERLTIQQIAMQALSDYLDRTEGRKRKEATR